MNKQEAQEYFQQLKKMDKAKGMQLPEVIAILTNRTISINRVRHFVSSVASNQFGQYAPIYDYTQETDWKKLSFSQVYLILKYLKEYLKQEKEANKSRQKNQVSEKGQKDIASSFDSKLLHSRTVQQIMQNLHHKQGSTRIDPVQVPKEQSYEQKWKHLKFKLVKKLLIVFDYMRKSMHIEGESFDKNKQISQYMNLNMFMKYVKIFELGNTFKPHKIIKAFKHNAINTIWLDFDRFVNTNLYIINFRTDLPDQQKYLRLRGLIALVSSENIKKMLNIKRKTALATIVEGHTGTYKQDILDFLQQKLQQRKQKEQQRWSSKRLKTEVERGRSNQAGQQNGKSQVIKSKSSNKISARTKSEQSQSIYQQLKLPVLRLKQRKTQSIYQSLKRLDLSAEKQRLRDLINIEENQQYLDLYLREEAKCSQKKKHRPKKLHQLPPMRFS